MLFVSYNELEAVLDRCNVTGKLFADDLKCMHKIMKTTFDADMIQYA